MTDGQLKDFITLTAKDTAHECVREFRATLDCNKNDDRIGDLEQTVNNGIKDRGVENTKSIKRIWKFVTFTLISIIFVVVGSVAAAIFT